MTYLDRFVAEGRAGGKRDLDVVMNVYVAIHDSRRDRSGSAERVGGGKKAKGDHSDPTGEAASVVTPAMEWLDEVNALLVQLNRLAAKTEAIVGKARCGQCGEEIGPAASVQSGAAIFHKERCYKLAWDLKRIHIPLKRDSGAQGESYANVTRRVGV